MKWKRQKQYLCGHCLKGFDYVDRLEQHARDAHKDVKQFRVYECLKVYQNDLPEKEEREIIADRMIQAEIDRACGVPNDDIMWLP